MDIVKIEGLELMTLIGVYDFERHAKQRVIVDIDMYTDLSQAGISDNVADTVDYGAVAERMADIADAASYQLLEALAGQMMDCILSEFNVNKATLKLSKPDILKQANNVAICISREASA